MQLRLGGRKRKKSESSHILTSPDNNNSRGENLNTIARIETINTVNTRSRSNSAWNQSAPISPVELENGYDKDDHYPPLPTFLAPSPEPTRPPPIFAPSYRRFSFPIRPAPTPATRIINPINTSQRLAHYRASSPSGYTDLGLGGLQVPEGGVEREQTSSLAVHERTPFTTPSPAIQDPQAFAPRLSQIHRGWAGYPDPSHPQNPTDEMATLTATTTHLSSPQRSTSPVIIHHAGATPSSRSRTPAIPRTSEEVFPGANALRLSMEAGRDDLDIMKLQRRNLDPSVSNPDRDSIDLDIERGLQLQELRATRPTIAPIHSRNQSAATSANTENGSPLDLDEDEWNDSHPCYPHRNPYVPPTSSLYEYTRIIRVPRDFMLNGDITPGFSNIYPQIMEPYISEETFRQIVSKVNRDLRVAFDPFDWRNLLDGVMGVLTFWMWEDLKPGGTFAKRKLERVEEFLEDVTRDLQKDEKTAAVISLRRTGYANLDFQIPNPMPKSPTPSQKDPGSRPGTSGTERMPWSPQ